MTRRKALSPDQLRHAFEQRSRGHGYGTIAKSIGSKPSTVRDAVQLRTAYAAAMKAKVM
jgi:hypothetical protein